MNIHKSQFYTHLPISLKKSTNPQYSNLSNQPQQSYLQILKQQLINICHELQTHQTIYHKKIKQFQMNIQQRQKQYQYVIDEMKNKLVDLQGQNYHLKQKVRILTRKNRDQINKNIEHDKLNKIIIEKQAIIKYLQQKNKNLQQKNQSISRYSLKTNKNDNQSYYHKNNDSNLIERDISTSINHQKSYVQIKNTPSLTFADCNMSFVKVLSKEKGNYPHKQFIMKNKRTKTQSFQTNQNINQNYISNASKKLKNLLNNNQKDIQTDHNSSQNSYYIDQLSQQYRNSTKKIDLTYNYMSNKTITNGNTKNIDKSIQSMKKGTNYMHCHSDLHSDRFLK